ncbi:HWE histidine kinase domain-containing protein [Tsuneonella sp. HG222]
MNWSRGQDVDLSNCDREPIHRLGMIQPFGCLIAATSDWMVAHRSVNVEDMLGIAEPVEIGSPLGPRFAPEAFEIIRERLDAASTTGEVERVFGLDLFGDHRLFDLAVHLSGRMAVLEIERHDRDAIPQHTGTLRPIMAKLGECLTVEDLCHEAARQMKRLLGFDRVMVYRFHPDQSGEVVAEARESELEAFLGLRYPQSDIPQQARALYLRNLFRIISDINADPVPIEPEFDLEGTPLDLSMSVLRAVSPIHIEYLRNMGVGASLSISIVIRGKLWGLFACHHYGPRVLPYSLRTAAELFSQLFSLQLEIAIANAGSSLAEKGRELHNRLMARLAGGSSLIENLGTIDEIVAGVIPHDGSSAFIEGVYQKRGAAPNEEEFRAIVPALNTASTSKVIQSDALATLIPRASAFADRVVGALAIPVSRRPRDYVVLWRKELPQVVTWAGNPEKPVEYGPHGARLTPRKSFEAWQQSVQGQSAQWTEEQLSIAEGLRVTLLEVILRVTDEAMQERNRAQQQQELLIAELNHRVRNILTLIRSLVGQSKRDAKNIEDFAEVIGGRVRALALAHDNITREHWNAASLHELIRAEAEAYLNGKETRVEIVGPDAMIVPEAYTVMALVLHEMITNSAKYGSLCDSRGRLKITTSVDSNNDYKLEWREIGGPPVQAPTRRGFGTTIIERSIPHDLRGEAEVRYRLSGVEADFCLPGRFVERVVDTENETGTMEKTATAGRRHAPSAIEKVLLVEDSMIIALDTEEALTQAGVRKVMVAGSADAALAELDKGLPDFALLDFNLGEETSERVAEALTERGVPFCFATGYGDALGQMAITPPYGVLKKPYSREDIVAVLDKVVAAAGT